MPPSRGCRTALLLSAGWLMIATGIGHQDRAREVDEFERSVVYLCMHWSDGLPLMPRQSSKKCYRRHVVGNPVRKRFVASGWAEDIAAALLSLAGFWAIGILLLLLSRRRKAPYTDRT